jgi:hypothetical protein
MIRGYWWNCSNSPIPRQPCWLNPAAAERLLTQIMPTEQLQTSCPLAAIHGNSYNKCLELAALFQILIHVTNWVPFENTIPLSWSINAPPFMEPEGPYHISFISILILSSYLRLGVPSGLFPLGLPTKFLYIFLSSHMRAICRPTHCVVITVITCSALFCYLIDLCCSFFGHL